MEVTSQKPRQIYDPIYGFIKINPIEWEIIHSPFYQRLRWIKQLGFSCYVFPGAEHSRFGHSIGVMNNAHAILTSCERAVPDVDLMNVKCLTKEAIYHKSLRIAALLHDLGTFVFSHTTEMAYIAFAETTKRKNGKGLVDDHENLGSFIIKNTDYEGGITFILKKYGLDPQEISDLVKGISPSILANQILHSEVDCDRMDYLLRDAHYTGLKYGAYDRDYLLHHFRVMSVDNHDILTIKENALHSIEDFLTARFAWYSQVIRSPRGAKFDAVAEKLCYFFLEKEWMHRYSDLLEMIENDAVLFNGFNDNYFMGLVHKLFSEGKLDKYPKYREMAEMLLFAKGPKAVKCEAFKQCLLSQDDLTATEKVQKRALAKFEEIEALIAKKGTKKDWVINDLPTKNIIFMNSHHSIVRKKKNQNILLERDPVKISRENGEVILLADAENSLLNKVQNTINYTPNVYCSESAYELLKREKIIE